MRILLIKTYEEGFTLRYGPPLGLMYIASSIKHEFKDAQIEILDPRPLKMNISQILDYIDLKKPDIVGTSSLTCEAPMLYRLIEKIKEKHTSMIVISGGPHADATPKDILANSPADFAITGEGEKTVVDLLDAFNKDSDFSKIDGIVYRSYGKIIVNPKREFIQDIDNIPFPSWELIKIEDYGTMGTHPFILKSKRWMPILTSRACPYNCTYCHNIFGRKPRLRSPENVIKELRILSKEYAIDEIQFMDDMFNFNLDRAKQICDLILETSLMFDMSFPNGLRGDRIDEELIAKLKKAGTYFIAYAFESASDRVQKMIKKRLNIERAKQAVEYTNKHGILSYGFFMLGFPTETIKEIHETIDLACSTKLHMATFPQVVPYPGTELFDQASSMDQRFKERFDKIDYETEESFYSINTGIDLKKIQSVAYRKFYFNPIRVIRMFILFPRKRVLFIKSLTLLRYFFRIWDKLSKVKA
jgi:anaerobic magnesium-protoporphyrin IX monomethyl ester cyclase